MLLKLAAEGCFSAIAASFDSLFKLTEEVASAQYKNQKS
jgi:hypothetical protein